MKLCYPVAACDGKIMGLSGDFEKNIATLAKNGFTGAELMIRDPDTLNVSTIKKVLENENITVAAVGITLAVSQDRVTIASSKKEIREEALRRALHAVEFAAEWDAPFCIGSFRGNVDETGPNSIEASCEAFKKICECAKRYHTKVLFEPQSIKNGNYLNSIQEGLEWIKKVGYDNLQMILDLFHMDIVDPDLNAGLALAVNQFGLVHLCDSDRQVPGTGRFDLLRFVSATEKSGYDGFYSTEITQLPDQETAISATASYYRHLQKQIYV